LEFSAGDGCKKHSQEWLCHKSSGRPEGHRYKRKINPRERGEPRRYKKLERSASGGWPYKT